MKKILKYLILCIFLCAIHFSSMISVSIHKFDSIAVKRDIDYLCSDYFKGRLAGTLENHLAANFIKDKFKSDNIAPFVDGYFDYFKVCYPKKLNDKPYLKVIDNKNKIIKEFVYGKDFKESISNFKVNNVTLDKNSLTFKNGLVFTKDNNVIFYCFKDKGLDFRGGFFEAAPYDMLVLVSETTVSQIQDYINKGYKLSCYIPYEIQKTSIPNVLGYIKGRNSDISPIIISAHFDHVGSDLGGKIYRGALDNASGTCFMLEISKYIKSLGLPERDIIFAAFNAEESGLLGSSDFVNKYKNKFKNSIDINFDMIGSDQNIPLCIMGSDTDTPSTSLIKNTADICKKNGISFNYLFTPSSDHASFRSSNIEAITFIDNDMSRIHTPSDNPEFISTSSIDRCFNASSKTIIKFAFNNNPVFIYYKQILIASTLITLMYILIINILESRTYRW